MRDGVYAYNGCGMAERALGREALLQEVYIRLKTEKGSFPYDRELGSLLRSLPEAPAGEWNGLALSYAQEALLPMADVYVLHAESLPQGQPPASVEIELDVYGVREKVRINLT